MLRMASLGVAALLIVGGLTCVGCQNDDYNRDNSGSAQTSSSVYTGTPAGADNSTYNGSGSVSVDRNEEPGRGLSSSNMETHGGPSRITGGEDVDHQGIGATGDMRAGSGSTSLDSGRSTLGGSGDFSVPTIRPSDAIPTTQPSVEISR